MSAPATCLYSSSVACGEESERVAGADVEMGRATRLGAGVGHRDDEHGKHVESAQIEPVEAARVGAGYVGREQAEEHRRGRLGELAGGREGVDVDDYGCKEVGHGLLHGFAAVVGELPFAVVAGHELAGAGGEVGGRALQGAELVERRRQGG